MSRSPVALNTRLRRVATAGGAGHAADKVRRGNERATVPRGRHAPPLEVRLTVQRRRLYGAAAAVFARTGYVDASAEAISRQAGMSKATFYEHFANKEDCILALFDEAATEVLRAMAQAAEDAGSDPRARCWRPSRA